MESTELKKLEYERTIVRDSVISALMLSERAVSYMVSNEITQDETHELWCYVHSIHALMQSLSDIVY